MSRCRALVARAYKRLTSRVGTIRLAALLNPEPPTTVGYEPSETLDYLVVMAAVVDTKTRSTRYAYLLLVDPTYTEEARFLIRVRFRLPGGGTCLSVPTFPSGILNSSASDESLPSSTASYADDEVLSLPTRLSLEALYLFLDSVARRSAGANAVASRWLATILAHREIG